MQCKCTRIQGQGYAIRYSVYPSVFWDPMQSLIVPIIQVNYWGRYHTTVYTVVLSWSIQGYTSTTVWYTTISTFRAWNVERSHLLDRMNNCQIDLFNISHIDWLIDLTIAYNCLIDDRLKIVRFTEWLKNGRIDRFNNINSHIDWTMARLFDWLIDRKMVRLIDWLNSCRIDSICSTIVRLIGSTTVRLIIDRLNSCQIDSSIDWIDLGLIHRLIE